MKTMYQYAIIRFLPFPETEEFANIGVVVCLPQLNHFEFRLDTTRRTKRVSDFFDLHHCKSLYVDTLKAIGSELGYFKEAVEQRELKALQALELTQKPRETIIRFSGIRAGITQQDTAAIVDDVFAKCVVQPHEIKERREVQLERDVRCYLDALRLSAPFRKDDIGSVDTFQVTLPLVQKRPEQTRVIKPLFLGQVDPSKVMEHGDKLISRLNRLRKFGDLPDQILVTWDCGEKGSDALQRNQDMVLDELGQFPEVELATADDQIRLRNFATVL